MYYLGDTSVFNVPLPPLSNWGKRIANVGENPLGKVFLKNAQKVKRFDRSGKLLKETNGLWRSGKTIRKTPFAVAAGGLGLYGGYRVKKKYDEYKPQITTARKLYGAYSGLRKNLGLEN